MTKKIVLELMHRLTCYDRQDKNIQAAIAEMRDGYHNTETQEVLRHELYHRDATPHDWLKFFKEFNI